MITIKELINLKGRCALITGAGGVLGQVMAETLAELGADLIFLDKDEATISDLRKRLKKKWNIRADIQVCDLEQPLQRESLIKNFKKNNISINILINNAAFVGTSELQGWSVPFQDQSIDTWRRALEVNLTAVFDLCQGLAPEMKLCEGANIINIGSIYGIYGPDWGLYKNTDLSNPAAYGVSKGGLIQLTKWLSTTLAPDIRVNSISPGGIYRNQSKIFVKQYEERTPLKRMGREDDFCGAIAYLSTDMGKYVTGQNLQVDGGWGVW